MVRRVYHVSPHPRDGWGVKLEGSTRFMRTFDTKAEAKSWAKKEARKNRPSEVKVKGRDGRFMPDRGATYPRDSDPYPPKG